MTPTLNRVPEAYLDAKRQLLRNEVATYAITAILCSAILTSSLIHTAEKTLYVFAGACLLIIVRVYDGLKRKHRVGVLHKLSQTRRGVVVKSWGNDKMVLEYEKEYFHFKKQGECKGAYAFDFQNGTYVEGQSISWTGKEDICL